MHIQLALNHIWVTLPLRTRLGISIIVWYPMLKILIFITIYLHTWLALDYFWATQTQTVLNQPFDTCSDSYLTNLVLVHSLIIYLNLNSYIFYGTTSFLFFEHCDFKVECILSDVSCLLKVTVKALKNNNIAKSKWQHKLVICMIGFRNEFFFIKINIPNPSFFIKRDIYFFKS